jgi:hypothetical protein
MDNNRKPKPTLTELAEAVLKLPWDALQAELAFRRMDRDTWRDMALGLVKKPGDFVQIGTYHPSPDPELPVKTYEAAMVKKWVSSTTPLHPRMGAKLVRTGDVDAGSDVYHQCEPDSDQWTHTLKGYYPQDTSKLMLTMRHVNADIIVRADQVTFKQPTHALVAAPGQKLLKAGTLMYREPSTGRLHVYGPDTPAGVERFLLAHDVDIDSLTLQPISLHAYQPTSGVEPTRRQRWQRRRRERATTRGCVRTYMQHSASREHPRRRQPRSPTQPEPEHWQVGATRSARARRPRNREAAARWL